MLTRIDLSAAGGRALDALMRAGFDAAEVYAARSSTLALELHYGRLTRPLYAGEQGVRVRALRGRLLAEAFTDDLSDASLRGLPRLLARAGVEAPEGFTFSRAPRHSATAACHFDPAVLATPLEAKWALVRRLAELTMAQNVEVKAVPVAVYRQSIETACYRNSHGVHLASESTGLALAVDATAQKGERSARGSGVAWSSALGRLAPEEAAEHAAEVARLRLHDAAGIPARAWPVLFRPAASALFASLIAAYLEGGLGGPREGGPIRFDPRLAVIDDASIPGAPASIAFDCEGTPARPVRLVEGGEARDRLRDRLAAARDGGEPTGSCRLPRLSAARAVSPSNLYLAPADALVDPPAGEFLEVAALEAPPDFWNEGRTLKLLAAGYLRAAGGARPFAGLPLRLPLDRFPAPVVAVGADLRFFPHSPRGVAGGPSLLCEGVEAGR